MQHPNLHSTANDVACDFCFVATASMRVIDDQAPDVPQTEKDMQLILTHTHIHSKHPMFAAGVGSSSAVTKVPRGTKHENASIMQQLESKQ